MIRGRAIQQDEPLLTMLRYVERNALRPRLPSRAEDRPWGSLADCGRVRGSELCRAGYQRRNRLSETMW